MAKQTLAITPELKQRGIKMRRVYSGFIFAIGYSAKTNTVVVEFKSGCIYQYQSPQSLFGFFGGMLQAKAPGKTFAKLQKLSVCVRVA